MKQYFADWHQYLPPHILKAIYKLQENKFTVFVVGGAVRDLLLGIKPKDIDLVTNAKPEEILPLFDKTLTIGVQFGITMVVIDNKNIEIATFRKDKEYKDARHPEGVEFSEPEEDAKRRDFTINGLFWDPATDQIYDYINGVRDLNDRIIRAIGQPEKRFEEDALRMLRAVRLLAKLARYKFTIEAETLTAIEKQKEKIKKISKERITQEMKLLLSAPRPSLGLFGLQKTGLLTLIFPEIFVIDIPKMNETFTKIDFFKEIYQEIRAKLKKHEIEMKDYLRKKKKLLLLWAFLLQDIKYDIDNITKNFIFSKKELLTIKNIIELQPRFQKISEQALAPLKQLLQENNFMPALMFFITNEGSRETADYCLDKFITFTLEKSLNPISLLTGDDLKSLGIAPGAIYKKIFSYIREEQLAERLHTKEEAIALIVKKFI